MKKSLIITIVSLFIALAVFCNDASAAATLTKAKVTNLSGTVQVKKGGGEKAFSIFKGMYLTQGDTIITGVNSWVELSVGTDSDIKVSENTQILVSQLNKKGEVKNNSFTIFAGGIWANVKEKLNVGSKFEVKTPTAIMGVRGTKIYVTCKDGKSKFSVLSGKAVIKPNTTGTEVTAAEVPKAPVDPTKPAPQVIAPVELVVEKNKEIELTTEKPTFRQSSVRAIDTTKMDVFELDSIKKTIVEEAAKVNDAKTPEQIEAVKKEQIDIVDTTKVEKLIETKQIERKKELEQLTLKEASLAKVVETSTTSIATKAEYVGSTTTTTTTSSGGGGSSGGSSSDTTKPVITLGGASTVTVQVKSTYTDAGATATDNVDGTITSNIVKTGTVNTNLVGTYTLRYNVSDAKGNNATEVTRTVNVVDTVNPTFDAIPDKTYEAGTLSIDFTTLIANAADNSNATLTKTVKTSNVDWNTVGIYSVTLKVTDPSLNASERTFAVNIVDTTNPTFDAIGVQTYEAGPVRDAKTLVANIVENTDEGTTTTIQNTTVDWNSEGTYSVTLRVTDHKGLFTERTFTVNIVDTTPPTFDAIPTKTYEVGTAPVDFTTLIANLVENTDQATISSVPTNSTDWNAVGGYGASVKVTDNKGLFTIRTFAVNIVDTTKPTITLDINERRVSSNNISVSVTTNDNYSIQGWKYKWVDTSSAPTWVGAEANDTETLAEVASMTDGELTGATQTSISNKVIQYNVDGDKTLLIYVRDNNGNTLLKKYGPYIKDHTAIAGTAATVGSYVSFGKYNEVDIKWRVLNNGSGKIMLFSDKIITLKAFDPTGVSPLHNGTRETSGSSNWKNSSIRKWLNSVETSITYPVPPQAGNVFYNEYNLAKGFLNDQNFTNSEKLAIIANDNKTTLTYLDLQTPDGGTAAYLNATNDASGIPSANIKNSYYEISSDKVTLLSLDELSDYVYNNGSLINGTTYYKSKVTAEAISESTYKLPASLNTTDDYSYFLRTPAYDGFNVRIVNTNTGDTNSITVKEAKYGDVGIRPVIYLNSNVVLGTGNGADPDANVYKVLDYNN